MPGPHRAVAATRHAVRRALAHLPEGGGLLVACSGGADSLALAAAVAFEAPKARVRAGAIVVDHGLQPGSAAAAQDAARACAELGLAPAAVRRVAQAGAALQQPAAGADGDATPGAGGTGGGGPEARARAARYAAFEAAAAEHDAAEVWLAHTRDDQAEQVLLGLARGSGTRSLAGMPAERPPYRRPFLHLPRALMLDACAAQALRPWHDPTNDDTTYLRNRVRRALADLEDDLGPGLTAALSRSADLARLDADALDALAEAALADLGRPPWPVVAVLAHPPAIRGRIWRAAALRAGAPEVAAAHVAAADALLTRWRGQGAAALPGGVRIARIAGTVHLSGGGGPEWSPRPQPGAAAEET